MGLGTRAMQSLQTATATAVAAAVLLGLGLGWPAAAAPGTHKLPPTVHFCKKNDPNLKKCVKQGILSAIPLMKTGVPELGLPQMDPLHYPRLQIDNGRGAVTMNLALTDVYASRLQNIENVTVVELDLDKPSMRIEADLDRLKVDGPYKVDGRVLLLPLIGEGNMNATLDNAHYVLQFGGRFAEKRGRRYWDVQDFKFEVIPGTLSIHLGNLFNGDKTLGKQMNEIINDNSAEILAELIGPLQEGFGLTLRHVTRRLFSKVPFDDIFQD